MIADLPVGAGQLPGRGHWTRDIVFNAGASVLYALIGSYSDVNDSNEDESGRARVVAMDPLGGNRRVIATGLRNPVSMSISPASSVLWVTNNERDGLGDSSCPTLSIGGERAVLRLALVLPRPQHRPAPPRRPPGESPRITVPKVLLQAHSASLGSAFYTRTRFPAEYHGDLFVAVHGPWNRANPTGAKVIRLVFDDAGNAAPYYEDFMTGFTISDYEVWVARSAWRSAARMARCMCRRMPTTPSGAWRPNPGCRETAIPQGNWTGGNAWPSVANRAAPADPMHSLSGNSVRWRRHRDRDRC